ncbi:hypothetical protein [Rhizobium leguminosarum]
MSKLTRAEVFQRFEAALAILGEEDCDDAQADLRMKSVRYPGHCPYSSAEYFQNVVS